METAERFIGLSENARCVIVMTNLAFTPRGRKSGKSK